MSRPYERSPFLPTPQGALVVVGLIAFGLLVLGGVYLTPHARAPIAPAGVPLGVPKTTLRFVAYDLACQHPLRDPMFFEISNLKPDYVLLQGVKEDDAIEIAESLGMQKSFHPQLYQRSERIAGRKGTWGNLILSRQALYDGAPLGGIRGGFGGIAVSIVEDNEFFVANLHLSPGDPGDQEAGEMAQIWTSRGSPPTVAVVLPSDPQPPNAMAFWTRVPNVTGECFYLTSGWKVIAGGTVPKAGSGLGPTWIDITRTPEPASRPAE